MQLRKLIFLFVFIGTSILNAQVSWQPNQKELTANINFLSSPLLEGREAGERGGFIAAEYIASMMEQYGLEPAVNGISYFQDFNITRTKEGSYSLNLNMPNGSIRLENGIDFIVKNVSRNFDVEAPIVFVGYGLSFPESGYDSYKGIDVKGKIVVVIDDLPKLPADKTSASYKAIQAALNNNTSFDARLDMAKRHGAAAMLMVCLEGDIYTTNFAANSKVVNESYPGKLFPSYKDASYSLPSDGFTHNLPCFILSNHASKQLFINESIELSDVKSMLDRNGSSAVPIKSVKAHLTASVTNDVIIARNILGMIKGKDTSKYIVVSAHYDHLGRRGDAIYYGADDNASGVSGMLSIAKYWSSKGEKPACNIIFASWTAEEKGMLGSRYFAQTFPKLKQSVLLNMNFDMISRPDTDDPENKTLYVGLLRGREDYRKMLNDNNDKLSKPFVLDPWETSGNGGSDYIAFSEHWIPVFAFFSGMHADYHSPHDTKDKLDMDRMTRIITLANSCLTQFMQEVK